MQQKSDITSSLIINIMLVFILFLLMIIRMPLLEKPIQGFIHGLLVWLPLIALVNRSRLLAWLILPVLLTLPMALYYEYVSDMMPGTVLWTMIFNSSPREIYEYLSDFKLPLLCWAVICLIGFAYLLYRIKNSLIFEQRSYRIAFGALLIIPLVDIVGYVSGNDFPIAANNPVAVADKYFEDAYPWSLFTGYVFARQEEHKLAANAALLSRNPIKVKSISHTTKPRTIILVIGESARRDRHHIYGYDLPNTPHAESTSGLLAFSNMVTLYPYTVDAVPVILGKYDKRAPHAVLGPNIVSLFHSAGYHTSWISNQEAMGKFSGLIGAYASMADWRWFSQPLSGYGKPSYDAVLLPKLREQLRDHKGDQFIVLHLYGSHEEAKDRYPPSFNRFLNPYDNSIYYTDFILNQVIAVLAQRPGENAMVYIADHGVELGECDGVAEEHFDIKQAYEVPFYIWMSPEWVSSHPQQYVQAKRHLAAPLTTMNVFDTLADLADLRYRGYQPTNSVFSRMLASSPRIVHTFDHRDVNYDTGHNNQQCHLTNAH